MKKGYDNIIEKLKKTVPGFKKLDDLLYEKDDGLNRIIRDNPQEGLDIITAIHHFSSISLEKQKFQLPENGKKEKVATVFFDIRSSQKLLEHIPLNGFCSFMNQFVKLTRKKLFEKEFQGIYDKFTGDGVIIHFTKEYTGENFIDKLLIFTYEIMQESKGLFLKAFEELDIDITDEIALSAGVDVGDVLWFRNKAELSCVGSSVVYASRLCSKAERNEILVNKLVYDNCSKEIFGFIPKKIKVEKVNISFRAHSLVDVHNGA